MVKFTVVSLLLLLFVFPAILASLIKMIPAADQPGYAGKGTLSIYGIREFDQTFISREKNLTAVATSIKNPNLKNKKDIIFKLFDNNNNLLRTVILNGFNIGDGDFVKFVFEPIVESKDVEYHFNLSSPEAKQDEVIEVFITEKTSEVIKYVYDEEEKSGGAPLVTFHKPENSFETIKKVYFNLFSKLLHLDSQKI